MRTHSLACILCSILLFIMAGVTHAQQTPSSTCPSITRFDAFDTISNGSIIPFFGGEGAGIAYDPANDDLYFAENPFTSQGLGIPQVIKIHRADGTKTVLAPPGGFGDVTALAFLNGNLYVADGNGYANQVASGQPAGLNVIWQYAPASGTWVQIENVNDPTGLAFDSAGNLYVSSWTDMNVYEFTYNPATQGYYTSPRTSWSAPDPSASPYGLAIDSADNLYIAGFGQSFNNGTKIFKVDQSGNSAVYFDIGITEPASLAFDVNGYLYASYYDSLEIIRIAPDLSYVVFPGGGTAMDAANGIVISPQGDLFTIVNGSSTFDSNPAVLQIHGLVQPMNAAAEFSRTGNPNASWSYGYSNGSGFTLLPTPLNLAGTIFGSGQSANPGLDFWTGSSLNPAGADPDLFHNGTSAYISMACCNPVPPGSFGLQPGPNGSSAMLRWTSPFSGNYQVMGVLSALDFSGPTSSVGNLAYNSAASLTTMSVSGFGLSGLSPFWAQTSTVACDTLDVNIGAGGNNLLTGLDVLILPAPNANPFLFPGANPFSVSPGAIPLWYGAQSVGITGTTQVTIAYSGASPYSLSQTSIVGTNAGDFHILADNCSNQTINTGGTCNILVTFLPGGVGARSAVLQLNTSAPPIPVSTIPLAGVGEPNTQTGISANVNPAGYGASVVFTAKVSSVLGLVPVGSVQFYDGTTEIGTATLDATGSAQFSYLVNSLGSHNISAAYIPAANQGTFVGISAGSLAETIIQGTPAIAWPAPAAIAYGTSLSGVQLNATANVPGTFSYSPSSGTLLSAGTTKLTVTFTPTDNTDYTTATASVQITVSKATPAITWATPAAVTYGTPLTSAQLDATSSVPGSFAYTPVAGTLLNAATNALNVNFTPTDSTDYTTTSASVFLVVNKAPSTVNLTSSPNPSVSTQSVVLTATIVPQLGGTATGTVTFMDSVAGTLGSSVVSGNVASLSTPLLSATGTHSITASYSGDNDVLGSTSANLTQTVNAGQLTTTTKMASSVDPSYVTQPVTFTAAVVASNGMPATGTVSFRQGSTTLYTATLAGGVATYMVTFATSGTRNITAVYAGSGAFLGSTSAALTQRVLNLPAATSTMVTSSGSPSFVGQPVTFTATVTVPSKFGPIPDGEIVTFTDGGGAILGTAPTSGGVASLTYSGLSGGSHPIRASYPGDTTFAPSTFSITQVVNKYSTVIAVTSSLNPSTFGQALTFTATVTSTGPSIPIGNVVFRNGSTTLASVALNTSGIATLTCAVALPCRPLPAGTSTITANYTGDSQSATSSTSITQVVNKAVSTITLTSSRSSSTVGQSVTIRATVSSPTATPTGTVTFVYPTTSGIISTTVNLSGGGTASFSTTGFPSGANTINATYNGTANILATSGSIMQQVN